MKKNPLTSNSFLAWILVSLTILTAQNTAQAQTYYDTAFNNPDWNSVLMQPLSTTGADITTTPPGQDPAGNTTFSRKTTHIYPTGDIFVAHIYQKPPLSASTYNPASQGAIVSLSSKYDLIYSSTISGNVAYSLLLRQNGHYYHAQEDYIGSTSWTTFSTGPKHTNLTAASFVEVDNKPSNNHPDFSCKGSPIEFGYLTRNHQPIVTSTKVTTVSSIDNWGVNVDKTTTCCVSRPPNMVGWWQLDEPNGAAAVNDIAGFNNQGIPKPGGHVGVPNGPSSVAGEVHTALYFAGPYVEVAPQADLDFGVGDFSIDAWVKPVDCSHSGAGHYSPIVDKFKSPVGYVFYLDQPTVGVARLYLKINGSPAFVSTGTIPVLSTATWSHVAVTVARPSGGGAAMGTFYINGLLAGTFTPSAGSVNNTFPMWIGKTRLPGGICENAIDELELFNRALSAAEVKSIADAKSAGKCP